MNYLAHLLIAGPADSDRLGALLGDFVKGPLPGALPPALAQGVALHRALDRFADTHPAFLCSRARVSNARRRYAGIMVDLYYDHFLARHWARFHPQPLAQFAAEAYALFDAHRSLLPAALVQLLPVMRDQDWLSGYARAEATVAAVEGIARRRLTMPNRLQGGGAELYADYAGFEADCLAFIPAALVWAHEQRQVRAAATEAAKGSA